MKTLSVITTLGAVAALAGCVTAPSVDTTAEASPDLPDARYEDFAFLPQGDSAAQNTNLGPNALRAVEDAIEDELERKGYDETDERSADFFVTFHTKVDATWDERRLGYQTEGWRTSRVRTPNGDRVTIVEHPNGWVTGTDYDVERFAQSTLIVDIIDAKTRDLAWRGWARQTTPTPALSADDLREGTIAVLRQFPSRG